jgi:hypothetical protein
MCTVLLPPGVKPIAVNDNDNDDYDNNNNNNNNNNHVTNISLTGFGKPCTS